MKKHGLWLIISANLVVLVTLAFIYPHLMVSPGPLVAGHADLATDCFACHAPLRGASAQRCVACHAVTDIGLRTSKGAPIVRSGQAKAAIKTSFHQALSEPDCMACHSDHAGPKLTQRSRKPFSHELLKADTRTLCVTCHAAPANELHRRFDKACVQCHKTEGWKPASFDHAKLNKSDIDSCSACHKPPVDALHRQIVGNCGQCHASTAWKPATFAHDKLFVLDRDHNVACVTCHVGNNYSRYSCYGCHEHTPARIRAEHEEEGIRNFDNCVRCHRSASDKGEGGDRGAGGGRRQRD
ncbi:MAG: hypothetical protein RIQ60_1384 [Pseudomonadota bacterium]|jgi:predicted CXXCH cytochrome family protein